ncbi:hypothetical protein K8S19_01085 [bacterium]|nr:hypothetical protein [bacterium]
MFLVVFSLMLLAVTLLVVLGGMRIFDNRKVEQIWTVIQKVEGEGCFSEQLIQELPEAVRKYFLHAIAPGTRLAASAELQVEGRLAMAAGKKTMPMNAEEILTGRAFVWQGHAGQGLWHRQGNELYIAGTSRKLWWRLFAMPAGVKHGADHARFAVARAALGRLWLPSTLLPMYGVKWSVIQADLLLAVFRIDDYLFELEIKISETGAVLSAQLQRWGSLSSKLPPAEHPYGILGVTAEKEFSGYTIPAKMEIGWMKKDAERNGVYHPEIIKAVFR